MILSTKVVKLIKPLLFVLLIIPSVFWLYLFVEGRLGINPIDKLEDKLGELALRLLILTLLISSLSKIKYLRALQILRRMIGLFAFYYVMLHFTVFIAIDHFFNWQFILKDIVKRPFITFGFISFLLLIPLATTSTNNMVKKISYRIWKKIHMLIYIVAPLAALHFFLLTKANKIEPIIYLSIIFILLLWRLYSKLIKN